MSIGIGITSLIAYIIAIIVLNIGLKRKMGEAMMWSVLMLILISITFGGKPLVATVADSFAYSARQEVVYAGLAFVVMAFVMENTGIITRLVSILNSLLGRLPGGAGYVATIGCALFGMVSGVASASTAAIGSVTIPWMRETGWSNERAASIVAGNGGLGNVFPPSSVMMLFLGIEAVSLELTSGQLYVGLMTSGMIVLAIRLFLVYIFAKQDGIKAVDSSKIQTVKASLEENGSALFILLGVVVPLLITMGPTGRMVAARVSAVKGAFGSISLILYIPILITLITIIEGWKYLPHTFRGWYELLGSSIGKFSELGALLFFAFTASRLLTGLNLSAEFNSVFSVMSQYSPMIIILSIAVIITMMVGPFNATATTSAMGAVCYAALRSIGLAPVTAAVAFINLVSNQSCVPPNSAPIYIASGIAEVEEPFRIFKTLFFYYALPEVLFAILVMMKIIPIVGA